MGPLAIVGTAPTWAMTPFADLSVEIWSLNDAYRLKGFRRATRWYDFHPLDKFYHPKGPAVAMHEVPIGYYVRPAGHIAWLSQLQIPLYLHPAYQQQHPPANAWGHAHAIPKTEIEAAFGRYFGSSPAWMLAHAILEGYRDVSIYGIHLATEHEYIEQRPNFEFLCGRVLGSSTLTMTVKDGMRHYQTRDGHIAFPVASPVLQAKFQYAFETRPNAHAEPLKWEIHKLTIKRERVIAALKQRPWYRPFDVFSEPNAQGQPVTQWCSTSALQTKLWYLDASLSDRQDALARLHLATGGR